MSDGLDVKNIRALAWRTFRQSVESPMAYIVAFFFYGFLGGIFGSQFLFTNNGSVDGLAQIAPWALWIVIPALTMGLISEELRSGTFEHLSTLPLRDWEIVLGKFFGMALLLAFMTGGLLFYPVLVALLINHPQGLDWGAAVGVLSGLYFLSLFYAAIGLFASSFVKNQVVALIGGMILCTLFFFIGQFSSLIPLSLTGAAEWVGVNSHLETLSRGVWDLRDVLYFFSMTGFFLYLASLRLSARRF
jgi:ABC-2 type transport system permease protein